MTSPSRPARIKPSSWRTEAARLWREFMRTGQERHLKAWRRHIGAIGGRSRRA